MKILTLIIKQQYFNEILSGTKKQEFREIKPTTAKRLIQFNQDGTIPIDKNENSIPIKYDALRLYAGYNKNRDTMLVEVKSASVDFIRDDNGEQIKDLIGKDEKGQDVWWWFEEITYNLGKVLEYQIKGGEIVKPKK